jgi:hypothetical protein
MKNHADMTEPEPNDIGTTVLYILFSLIVGAVVAAALSYFHLFF